MKITAIDGHPGTDRLVTALMDRYLEAAEEAGAKVTRFALRDMDYDPILHEGYKKRQDWELDLVAAMDAIQDCNHLLLGFPMWWGGQPASLKGFFDRVFYPGWPLNTARTALCGTNCSQDVAHMYLLQPIRQNYFSDYLTALRF